jgi:hypothetical protein
VSNKIAFSTFLTNVKLTTDAQTLVFGGVVLNDGNAYDRNTGIFTVPVDGVYLFSYAANDYHGHLIYVQLVVNGNPESSVYMVPSTNKHMMGSNTVILRLRSGQQVSLRMLGSQTGDSLQGTALLRTNTFSGALLYT